MRDWDVIVIGGGPAGRAAALAVIKPSRRVLLVDEAGTTGWQNLLPGYVDAFVIAAHDGSNFGQALAEAKAYQDQFLATQPLKRSLQAAGIAVVTGRAEFVDSRAIAVKHDRYRAKRFIIATGRNHHGHKNLGGAQAILELQTKPARCILIDPDETMMRFAKALVKLGSQVSTIESQHVASVQKLQRSVRLNIHHNELTHATAELIISGQLGSANLSCEPENAGVKLADDGIMIDRNQRTSIRMVFAAGDCIASNQSHLSAAEQGHLAGVKAAKGLF